jgi:hypothetical protein
LTAETEHYRGKIILFEKENPLIIGKNRDLLIGIKFGTLILPIKLLASAVIHADYHYFV